MSEFVQNCHVDYFSMTVKPYRMSEITARYTSVRVTGGEDSGEILFDYVEFITWFIRRLFGPVAMIDPGRGILCYSHRFDIPGVGLVAWGGNNDTILFQFSGEGCAAVADWGWLADVCDDMEATITRIDLAHDDYEAETISIAWALDQYAKSGFKPSRGMSPDSQHLDDMGSGKGSTVYVGSRLSGKLCRIYEKGKQLGDPSSRWTRFEVEWRKGHRDLSSDMLRDPSAFLAGSYPCAAVLGSRHCQVKTRAFSLAATVQKAKEHSMKQAGGFVRAMLDLGHSASEVVAMIVKPKVSVRLAGALRDLSVRRAGRAESEVLNPAWWKHVTPTDINRVSQMLKSDFKFWCNRWSQYPVPESQYALVMGQ